MKKYLVYLFLFVYFFTGNSVFALESTSTGFIPGPIWYSKSTLIEGDTINIYTGVWNNDKAPLSAKVNFYDKETLLGTKDINILPKQLKEVSISWIVTAGDHIISAKIVSPLLTSGGKKQAVILENNFVDDKKIFVPLIIKTIDGNVATNSDVLKNQLDKVTSKIEDALPSQISEPFSKNAGTVDTFRTETYEKINENKIEAQSKIDELNRIRDENIIKNFNADPLSISKPVKVGIEEGTSKPITYLKLFFFTILSFIFGYKIIFYLLIIIIAFLIIRAIYRKIRYQY